MINSWRTHFNMWHHMHLHALLSDFPMRVFQVTSLNLSAKTWNFEALKPWTCGIWVPNMWWPLPLLSLKFPSRLSYLQLLAFYYMAQSNRVNRNQPRGICIHGWSQVGPCLGESASWFNFLLLRPNIINLVLAKMTSRLEEVQNSQLVQKSL